MLLALAYNEGLLRGKGKGWLRARQQAEEKQVKFFQQAGHIPRLSKTKRQQAH